MMWQEKKIITLRAFASRANKPFAGKFAKDWKKSLKKVLFEKNLALQAQSLLWKFQTRLTCKWITKFWINVFRIWINDRKVHSKIVKKPFFRKKVTSKTQEINAKYLKQSDLRLFEEIWGKGWKKNWGKGGKLKGDSVTRKEKNYFKSFCFAS